MNEMENLDNYLNTYTEKFIDTKIINAYNYFKYENNQEEIYKIDLYFLLDNIYTNIQLGEISQKRLKQKEFRKLLLNKYNKCLITKNECIQELEACHLVEIKDNGCDNINNGIILDKNLHSTFDKNMWCINPDTLYIEIKKEHKGSIRKYENIKLDIELNPILYSNLLYRYEKFIELL
jgi:predicted restriction endonuclease